MNSVVYVWIDNSFISSSPRKGMFLYLDTSFSHYFSETKLHYKRNDLGGAFSIAFDSNKSLSFLMARLSVA
jgi:spore cortex formation protein SpoVR/YcgB (stage V sporulation)